MPQEEKPVCWICGSDGPLERERTLYGALKWVCRGARCRGA
jgi:hypothetical protein